MSSDQLQSFISLAENAEYEEASDDASGTDLLSSDVPDDEQYIPLTLYLSDNSGAANTVDISIAGDTVMTGFNLESDESRALTNGSEFGPVLPPIPSGENINIEAESDGVDATLIYVVNTEV